MIGREQINEVIEKYDKQNIEICTIGSHSALQIAKGAKDEGFPTLLICNEKSAKFYRRWPVVDEIITVDSYSEVLEEEFQQKLIDRNSIIVPHGSFVQYVGAENIKHELKVPMLGNRLVLEWESNRIKERQWFTQAGVKMPKEFSSPEEIDRLVIVKFPGARGGRGYFLARDEEEFYKKLRQMNPEEEDRENYTIQEYVIGTRFYPHFFYSPLDDEVELLGMDIRYESNVDGMSRVPNTLQKDIDVDPQYVVTGNIPVVIRESLLPDLMKVGRDLVETSKELFSPGHIGPFCVELVCTPGLEFMCFEISARIVAGTNLFIHGSPYSKILYDEPMSCGRRICREVNKAIETDKLKEILY